MLWNLKDYLLFRLHNDMSKKIYFQADFSNNDFFLLWAGLSTQTNVELMDTDEHPIRTVFVGGNVLQESIELIFDELVDNCSISHVSKTCDSWFFPQKTKSFFSTTQLANMKLNLKKNSWLQL